MDKITTVERTINYFELKPTLSKEGSTSDFTAVFKKIIALSRTKSRERFVMNNDKLLYLTDIKFDNTLKRISGKLLNIRMDGFPELMNTKDDAIRDITAAEEEGIIETSHFILSLAKKPMILSLEFNQYGPRINDFIFYLEHFIFKEGVSAKIEYNPFVRDDLENYKKRIHRVSSVVAKVHKDDVKRVNEYDKDLFDAIATAANISEAEYVTLELKYDYRNMPDTPVIRNKILKIINKLISNKKAYSVFTKLVVKAEDNEYNDKLKNFDLLNIWIKTRIMVEKKPKSRVIVSADIFSKMGIDLVKEFPGR
ncbi:hypothetical protein [Kaistella montana]|uniref:Uncharacterized protein n=1 Tax=Kaistella montana TaxID=1849733 RepID=A0ABW5K6U7_9FLAO|nr:hypothetical protein [Kaistella montana]MCQ4034855.1 hypothetical protein [Kaistella montana]